ncbi:MAG: ABC transporter substrate-binding protein [Actinomycetota bacterium]|nr:ABC transporter substrate-binding protein [Actinomycetota bacterium]
MATSCTRERVPPPEDTSPVPSRPAIAPLVIDVVADVTPEGASEEATNSYLDGMRLAVRAVNRGGGVDERPIRLALHDHEGRVNSAKGLIRPLISESLAVMYVGPGSTLLPLRPALEEAGTPVILLEGDLYTSRNLFREVFQTTIPWAWQATVIARYLVRDRQARDIVFLGTGPESRMAAPSAEAAAAYWGGRLTGSFTDRSAEPQMGLTDAYVRAGRADAVITFGEPLDALHDVNAIEEVAREPPRISGSAALLQPNPGLAHPEPGATACYAYTWAGWAQPIERVAAFRKSFRRVFGRLPSGFEQEGYDAVRVVVEGLKRTEGTGGRRLTAALERLPTQTFSSVPVDLGPDDHLFLPRDELGLFAVPGPNEELDPWQDPDRPNWRPLMRTFTYDGRRTNVLDRDKRAFFPFWRKNRPAPYYWQSRHGITTRPSDRLH